MTLYCILESCWRVDGKCSHRPRPPQQLFKAMDIVNNFTIVIISQYLCISKHLMHTLKLYNVCQYLNKVGATFNRGPI